MGPYPDSVAPSPITFSVKNPGTSYYTGFFKAYMKEVDGLNLERTSSGETTPEWNKESSVDKISKPFRGKECLPLFSATMRNLYS
jgi:hypothetical protein